MFKLITNVKQLLIGLIISIAFISNAFELKAGDIRGGDITYKFITKDYVIISIAVYAECGAVISPGQLLLHPPTGNAIKLGAEFSGGQSIKIGCKTSCDKCHDQSCNHDGIAVYFISSQIDLKQYTDCNFKISWEGCCRDNEITTGPTSDNLYLETSFNRCILAKSNPVFSLRQPFYICKGYCTNIFLSADAAGLYDESDKDSISYALVSPLKDTGTNVKYSLGYSYKKPFSFKGYPNADSSLENGCNGFHFNEATGELNFTPTKNDVSLLAIKAFIWHKDSTGKFVIIGSIMREATIKVIDCNNSPPEILGVNKNNQAKTVYAAQGEYTGINIYALDIDTMSLITGPLINNLEIHKASSPTKGPDGYFSFGPDTSQLNKTYKLYVEVRDNQCPITAFNQEVIFIKVVPPWPQITISKKDTTCNRMYLTSTDIPKLAPKYKWFINGKLQSEKRDFIYQPLENKTYKINLEILANNGATLTLKDTFTITNGIFGSAGADVGFCKGNKVTLNASNGIKYRWLPAYGLSNDTIPNPVASPDSTINYAVQITTKDGCVYTDSVTLLVDTGKITLSKDTTICATKTVKLFVKGDKSLKYSWSPSSGIIDYKSDTLIVTPLKTTTYTVTATNPNSCIKTKSVKITVSTAKANAGNDISICKGTGTTLHGKGGYTYAWLNNRGDTLSKTADVYVNPLLTEEYYLHVDDSLHCQHSIDNVVVNVFTLPLQIIQDTTICQGDTIMLWADGGDTYNWLPENTLSDINSNTPKAFPSENTTYTVYIQDTLKACGDKRSVTINVNKDCVWPGDVNKDGTVDYKDVLEIGVGYGSTGNYRENGTRNWKSAIVKDWDKYTYNNINYKHLDCNGDGYIDAADNFVISDNYGKTHASTFVNKAAEPSQDSIYFQFEKDTFYAGEIVTANLNVGSKTNPFTDAYGVAYQYTYTDKHNSANSISFKPVCEAICANNDFILQSLHNYTATRTGEIAQVRTDLKNISANGKLATFSYILEDSTHNYSPKGEWIYLKLLQTKLIDNQGKEYALKAINDSAFVLRSKTEKVGIDQTQSISEQIHIYPNPANNIINIQSAKNITGDIYITNTLGQVVEKTNMQNQQSKTIDVKHFSAGIYMVQLISSNNISTQKLIIYK